MGKRVYRNNYKRHMDNNKAGWKLGKEVGLPGVGGSGGEKMQTTVIEQQ